MEFIEKMSVSSRNTPVLSLYRRCVLLRESKRLRCDRAEMAATRFNFMNDDARYRFDHE